MFEIFLIIAAGLFFGLFLLISHITRVLFRQWKQEVVLHAETKRQLEKSQESAEFWRKAAAAHGERESVLDSEIIQ